MINFDSLSLKAFILENEPVFSEGRVQKVQQPSRKDLILNIRALGKSHKLYISIDPKYPHLAFISKKGEEKRNIQIPQMPPMFCMLLRKHLEGAKIRAVKQPDNERILEIYFDSYGEIGERVPLVLAIELMGKHSNIVLYNYDTNVIIGCAHNIGPEKSKERELTGGLPYIYPPKLNKVDVSAIPKMHFYEMAKSIPIPLNEWLNKTFYNISLALANEICEFLEIETGKNRVIATEKQKILSLYDEIIKVMSFDHINPSISSDDKVFSLAALSSKTKWKNFESTNEMLDEYFGAFIYQDIIKREKATLLAVIKKEVKKNKSKLSQHSKTVDTEKKADKYRQTADVIMANLHNIKTGQDFAQLENPYTGEKEKIKLDPCLSAQQNAQKYYKLYNKAKTGANISKEIIQKLEYEKTYLESVELSVNQSDNLDDLAQIREELVNQGFLKPSKEKIKKQKKEKIEVETKEINGFTIYIGKNNKQNDYLITKISAPNDIWLHTHNIPGSHVLIKIPSDKKEPENETLYEACKIAAYYSQARESSKVPVIYTKRKFLKKPPKSKPGYVTYSNEKTVFVE